MGHALMWIEGLAAMLLLFTLSVAFSAHRPRRLGQLALPLATLLPILALALVLLYGAALLRFLFHGLVPHDWFFYTLSWTLVFVASAIGVLSRGLKRIGAEQVPPARNWPRARLALALAGALILFAITLTNLDLAVKLQLAEARTEASAVLLAMTPPPIAEKDNAAPVYEEAFAALTPRESIPARWKERMESWRQKEWQGSLYHNWQFPDRLTDQFDFRDPEWKAFLDSQAKGLTLLRKAASKPLCRFPQSDPWTPFADVGWRYEDKMRLAQAAQLLALDARVQAAARDTHAAVDDIAAILGIARHMSDAAVEKEGWQALAAVLQLSAPSSNDLSRLLQVEGTSYLREFPKEQAALALRVLVSLPSDWPSFWFWDLTREVPFLHRKGQPMPQGYEAPMWFQSTIVPLAHVYLAPDELLFVQRSLRECRQALQAPQPPPFTDWQELVRSLEEQKGGYLFVSPTKTRLLSIARSSCNVVTLRRLSRLAIAQRQYKAKHGKYADTLDGLTPAFLDRLPNDPWDNGRLYGKRTEKGVMIYTLRNGTETPVLSPTRSIPGSRLDVVFRIEDK
jgi:hypothetical protein